MQQTWPITQSLKLKTAPAEFAEQLVKKAFQSGLFMFADSDLKFDQPQAEVVFDRDKVRAQGVNLADAGRDLSTMLGGDYVNRFSIQGRSYKVIPQVKRSERLTAEQLAEVHVTGAGGKLVPLSTFATLRTSVAAMLSIPMLSPLLSKRAKPTKKRRSCSENAFIMMSIYHFFSLSALSSSSDGGCDINKVFWRAFTGLASPARTPFHGKGHPLSGNRI